MEAIIFAGLVCLLLFVAVLVTVSIEKGKGVVRRMTPAEEVRFEIHPTLYPEPVAITAGNVQDVINDSIETGIEHPLLRARKGGHDA